MEKAKELLKQWAMQFFKSRDAFFKKIAAIHNPVENADFLVEYKDGKRQPFIMLPSLDDLQQDLAPFATEQHLGVVTLNNTHNREKLAEQWKSIVPYKLLTIYFANPFSQNEKKWVVMPYAHAKVCDDGSLLAGFNSLSEMVGDISEEEAGAKA